MMWSSFMEETVSFAIAVLRVRNLNNSRIRYIYYKIDSVAQGQLSPKSRIPLFIKKIYEPFVKIIKQLTPEMLVTLPL